MGNYREQYEKYYGNVKRQGAASYTRASASSSIKDNGFPSDVKKESILQRMTRKFIWQLSGSLILLFIVIGLKYVAVENGENEFYDISKEVLNKDIDVDITSMIMNLDIEDSNNYREKALDYIDEAKSYVSGERTLKQVIKEDYVQPVEGKIKYINGDSKGIAISASDSEEVDAAYGGVVEKADEDDKYVVINHGNGTETYYESLSEVDVETGDKVEKGEVIGKCGSIDMTDKKGLIFKFMYLGNEKNPSDVMDLSSLEEG